VTVVRSVVTSEQRKALRLGGTIVEWPAAEDLLGWTQRSAPDTSHAVTAVGDDASATVVYPFVRHLVPPPGDVIARWADGEPAATEQPYQGGCLRHVAVPVPVAGDLALTPAFRRFAAAMARPCRRTRPWVPVPDSLVAEMLPVSIPPRAVSSAGERSDATTKAGAWLLGLAMLVALGEVVVRRGATNATA
jgi:hypothetical protein